MITTAWILLVATSMVATAPPSVPRAKPKLGELVGDAFPALWRVPWLDDHQCSVLSRLARCGTSALGVMEFLCTQCGVLEWRPLGCQDRHCPSCGVGRTEAWAQARLKETMPVPYFHLVFTVPGVLYPLFRGNQAVLYTLFFAKVRETLHAFSSSPKPLGGTPAYFSVLHTTNRRLGYHPHVHVVMAGAALNEATGRFSVVPKDSFLFPVRALAASFRGRFLAGLRDLVGRGGLDLEHPATKALGDPVAFKALLSKLFSINWQVRIDPVEGNIERVIRYLARYTYRTAISNARIVRYDDGDVTYVWRDRKTRQSRSATLPLLDFIRRFSQHILPKGFHRVRFYGLLSPGKRGKALVAAQLAARSRALLLRLHRAVECSLAPEQKPALCCSSCGAEGLQAVAVLRGSFYMRINPKAQAIPPPGPLLPPRTTAC